MRWGARLAESWWWFSGVGGLSGMVKEVVRRVCGEGELRVKGNILRS